jgi:hydroxymethylbilane synthase
VTRQVTSLRLATRASAQARTQSEHVAAALRAATGMDVALVFVETTGDRRRDVPLHTIGGQGVFAKEVQRAVLDGDADLAVHSAKDLPSAPSDGLTIAAFATRRTANDALIGARLDELAHGATVATGSVRRSAQLSDVRPDLVFTELRGNIHTRLTRLPEHGALVMAVAALEVLGLTDRIAEVLPVERFVPSPGQGAVAVECRSDDDTTRELVAAVDDAATRAAVEIERAFLARLGSGCSLPVGAHVVGDTLHTFLSGGTGPPLRVEHTLDGSHTDQCEQAAELAGHMLTKVSPA